MAVGVIITLIIQNMMKHAAAISFYIIFIFASFTLVAKQAADTVIRYCVDPNWAPYESIENNQHIGLSRQYLTFIEQNSTLRFKLVPTDNWQQTIEYVKTGQCDLLPMLNKSKEREQFLSFSKVLFRAPNALYAHYDQPLVGNLASIREQTVAVVEGYRMHNYLQQTFPTMRLVTVANEAEGLNKVENQAIDFYVGSFHAANQYIKNNALRHLRIVGIAELEDLLRIGISKNLVDLLPELNRAIDQITPEQHAEVFSYLNNSQTTSKKDHSVAIKSAMAFTAVIVCLLFGYWRSVNNANMLEAKNNALELARQQLDEKNKQLKELAIRDPLTKLYNRSHLSEAIKQQIKLKQRYKKSACLLILDIDDFKKINDNFGHKVGDDVLVNFATLLTKSARSVDIVARWGGEEFVMLCPETDVEDAKIIAKRFQALLLSNQTDTLPNATCSIGIAPLGDDKDADQWFIAADNAMYQAKGLGKDSIFIIE
ncbi:diguanylate cyclase [Thalassotalea sediminis]|uniref:diguanylate cyclase n=1 Tax=Thalassotalea sediminis TaxID=1759089 RepID=UPI0025738227|nr:diguanylate cyclase [Thalassotalea sediminis]